MWGGLLPIIVVGATDDSGYRPDFVQYQPSPYFPGSGVDVFAPGVELKCDGDDLHTGTSGGKNNDPKPSNIDSNGLAQLQLP
jgi:hypothetical protein